MTTSLKKHLVIMCLCLCLAPTVYGQSVAPELNLTLGEQRVRFAPTRSFQEMRLEVVNSVGEIIFTHLTADAEFDWNLRAGNGEALAPGLYRYALTLKFSEDLSRQHTGHFIVEKGQDQIWLTAQDGAEISGTTLNATRNGGRSLAGIGRAEDESVKREVAGREIVDEKGNKLTDKNKSAKQEKAGVLATGNQLAKFALDGVTLIDSAVTETGGNVGVGTTSPNAKFSVNANTAVPPFTPGIVGYFANANESNTFITADSYGNGNWHSDFLFRRARGTMAAPAAVQADDIIGQMQSRGYGATGFATTSRAGIRMTAAQNWTDAAQGAYLSFLTTPIGSNAINTERMRITDTGNVGIGTPSPYAKVHLLGNSFEDVSFRGTRIGAGSTFSAPAATTIGILAMLEGSGHNGTTYTSGRAQIRLEASENWSTNASGTRIRFYTTDNGTTDPNNRMMIDHDGEVGIGTTAPDSRLHVVDSTPSATGVIYGETSSTAASVFVVVGEVTSTTPGGGSTGVRGINRGTEVSGYGVWGSHAGTGVGVYGLAASGGQGVRGFEQAGGAGYAGYFVGDVHVTNTLTKGGGAFKIDHPLDPENKYLSDSFVESPDMKNIYDGVATLDQYGVAEVVLPDWFSALNDKFRYQLTAIDAPGPNLYIAQKIADNRFKIAGGMPGLEVSWQVTGIRKDAFAEKYRIPVEELKPEKERGAYLHPEAFNQPEEKGVEWARHPEMMKQMKEEREKPKPSAPPPAHEKP